MLPIETGDELKLHKTYLFSTQFFFELLIPIVGWETSEARSCAAQLPAPGHGCLQPVNHFHNDDDDDDDDDDDEDDDDDNGDGYDDCRHLVTTAYNALSIFIAIWRITMMTVDGIRKLN